MKETGMDGQRYFLNHVESEISRFADELDGAAGEMKAASEKVLKATGKLRFLLDSVRFYNESLRGSEFDWGPGKEKEAEKKTWALEYRFSKHWNSEFKKWPGKQNEFRTDSDVFEYLGNVVKICWPDGSGIPDFRIVSKADGSDEWTVERFIPGGEAKIFWGLPEADSGIPCKLEYSAGL